MHAHACGEYVLHQLQSGVRPAEVVANLRSEYLVQSTPERVQAYRFYREQMGDYWTTEKLERLQWEFLYSQASLEQSLSRAGGLDGSRLRRMTAVRTLLCQRFGIAEELVPFHNLSVLMKKPEKHAQLQVRYHNATLVKDSIKALGGCV